MNCPRCDAAITKPARCCSTCRYDFGDELTDKLSFYFSWKDELGRLTELQSTLYAGIANVTAKIKRYEGVLKRDLARAQATVPPAGGRKSPPRLKKKRR
jgi:hypothetical protein